MVRIASIDGESEVVYYGRIINKTTGEGHAQNVPPLSFLFGSFKRSSCALKQMILSSNKKL